MHLPPSCLSCSRFSFSRISTKTPTMHSTFSVRHIFKIFDGLSLLILAASQFYFLGGFLGILRWIHLVPARVGKCNQHWW